MGDETLGERAGAGRDGLHVVLGARGGIGGAVVRELVGQGRRVRAVTRTGDAGVSETPLPPASYEDWACDLTDAARPAPRLRRSLCRVSLRPACLHALVERVRAAQPRR